MRYLKRGWESELKMKLMERLKDGWGGWGEKTK